MKRFIWLILLIGMISSTGFGATIDLPENSDIVTVDVDVGVEVAIVAEQMIITYKSNIWFDKQNANTVQMPILFNNIDFELKRKEEISTIYRKKTDRSQTAIYRAPRDALTC